ncbi:MAG TPA: hypothetical protein VK614_14540 [Allosphingosinicella sp.]|nr:hypothetical protein [Allosphingosinicella sp.]
MPNNVKIPRKIAGVKLPKRVRRKAKEAIKAGAGPVVREIAAAALGAAHARANVGRAGTRIEIDGGRIGEAFRSAAIDGLRRFLEGLEEGLRDDPQPDPPAKPKAAKKAKAAKSRPTKAKSSPRAPGV